MGNRIVLLGTGTCQLEQERATSSVLLELDGARVVFDFGRGVALRLAGLGLRQDDVEHVVLSHFHADHFSDLIPYLHAASWSPTDRRGRDLHLYCPPEVAENVRRLLDLFPPNELVREDLYAVHVHDSAEGALTVGGLKFETAELPPAGNHGLAFARGARRYALTGDSHYHDREVEFLRGAELAVIDSGHLTDEEIVELAARTKARRIVCSHLYRSLDIPRLVALAGKQGYEGELIAGHDLMTFDLSCPAQPG